MIEDIKKAFRQSVVYSLGNMSTKLIGLILIPLYTNQDYLTVDEYGVLGILEITSQVLVALMSLTLAQSLTRWFWDKNYIHRQKSIFFTSMIVLILVSALFLLGLLPFSEAISRLLFQSGAYRYVIQLLLLNTGLQILIAQTQTLLKLQSKALWYSLANITKLSITLGLTIYFILARGKKLDGIYEAQLIGSLSIFLVMIPYIIRQSKARFERRILREMLHYSLPLMLASVSGVFFSVIDRYSLNYLDGIDRVGVYNLGYKLASTLKLVVITSVQLALSPILMKKMNDPDNRSFYAKVMTYFALFLMFCVVGLSLFSLEVIKVASRDMIYWESAQIVAILSLSFFFSMLKDASFIGLQVVKRTRIAALLIAASSLINLGLNILLIPRYSIYGAAVGTLLSQLIFFLMIYAAAQKYYRIPYELGRVSLILFAGILLIGLGFLLNPLPLAYRLILKTLLLVSYPFLFLIPGFLRTEEAAYLTKVFQSWMSPKLIRSKLKRLFLKK